MSKNTTTCTLEVLPNGSNTGNENGFTLIEVVITIVLVSVLASTAAVFMLQGVKSYSIEQSRSTVHYQARLAVEQMAREIRLIRNVNLAGPDISIMNPTDISFTDIQNNQVRFQLNAGSIRRSPDNGTTWQPLASGVTALNFSYLQQDSTSSISATTLWFVVIDVTVQKGSETLEMRTRVHPMNF
jgi:prepilin-type N-terminal cleavage/methylation domain-containing protein